MVRIIGIDPGKNYTGVTILDTYLIKEAACGFGVTLCGCYLYDGKGRDLGVNVDGQAHQIRECVATFQPDEVIIEKPQIYSKGKARPNDILDLALMAGALGACGMPCTFVTPARWKGQVKKHIHNARILEKLPNLHEALAGLAKGKHEHIIDAAGLALWSIERKI